MKVREVRFSHIRGFGEALRRVTFFDPETDEVRPLTVLVGSNGCGKTTVLQLIEALYAPWEDARIRKELYRSGFGALCLSVPSEAPSELSPYFWSARGQAASLPRGIDTWPRLAFKWSEATLPVPSVQFNLLYEDWAVDDGQGPRHSMRYGLLYFPHDRWFEQPEQGGVSEPLLQKEWLFHFKPHSKWNGSLAQLWVWQNYLDLEAGREGRPNLLPFVQLIEEILGRGRRVVIHKARVHIQDGDRRVELHELPSGVQQILALFGEIIRQLRPGAVILIDEIEISLHPSLQRVVIAHLRSLARKYDLQIIVTTHSMDIVRSVSPREIVNMDDMVQTEQGRGA